MEDVRRVGEKVRCVSVSQRLLEKRNLKAMSSSLGEIVYVHALGKPMVILNSASVARELLEKRGANYSDRPRLVFFEM